MRFSDILTASLVAPLVAAHGSIPGAPKIFGLGQLKSRNALEGHVRRDVSRQQGPTLDKRQGGQDGRCGADFGDAICAPGYCCSVAGWCGQGQEYCQAPDCQFQYGPACDANQLPSGGSTRSIPRPKLGNVEYGGGGIYECVKPGTVAITYDDGPYLYTNDVMDLFASYNFKATFFITGINIGKGAIDDSTKPWPAMIQRMIAEGHQVASHTWSHQDLSIICQEERIDQMVKNEMAFANILGKFPTYMRPPYSSCRGQCEQDMADLGYVVSYFDLDTDDYNQLTPEKIQIAKDNFGNAINPSNPASDEFLAIGHDIHELTAHNLTTYMLETLQKKGYRGVTMGECMGDAEANWYREASPRVATSSSPVTALLCKSTSSASSTATSSGPTVTPTGVPTTDGQCGPSNGNTNCIGWEAGECCSSAGWCGVSSDHCGATCQPLFGKCGLLSSSSSAASTSGSVSSTGSSASSTISATSTSSSVPTGTPSSIPTTNGQCGPANGNTNCIGWAEGECCSPYGWCGKSTDHCGADCNPLFGKCDSSSSSSSSASSTTSSSSISSSSSASSTASSSSSSSVISSVVGSSTSSTASSSSVQTSSTRTSTSSTQSSTMSTRVSSTTSSTPSSSPTGKVSVDGTCGPNKGTHCLGFAEGECCSSAGWCGSSTAHCNTGCNPLYGKCGSSVSASPSVPSVPSASPTSNVSKNGKCGSRNNGQTCKGYGNKECCRMDGTCGNGVLACGVGCQGKYGTCWW